MKIIDKIKEMFFLDPHKFIDVDLEHLSHHNIKYKTVVVKNKTFFLADFKSSSLLKKLGFKTATNWHYDSEAQLKYLKGYKNNEDSLISAPTKNQVIAFISNKDKIHLVVYGLK